MEDRSFFDILFCVLFEDAYVGELSKRRYSQRKRNAIYYTQIFRKTVEENPVAARAISLIMCFFTFFFFTGFIAYAAYIVDGIAVLYLFHLDRLDRYKQRKKED